LQETQSQGWTTPDVSADRGAASRREAKDVRTTLTYRFEVSKYRVFKILSYGKSSLQEPGDYRMARLSVSLVKSHVANQGLKG